jgi:hypothetical protein
MVGFHDPRNRELHDQINQEAYRRMVPALRTLIERGVTEGVFQVDRPEAAAGFIVAASQVITEPVLFGQDVPTPLLVDDLLEFVLKGLGNQPRP